MPGTVPIAVITASILYDLVHCPHRVALDVHEDPSLRDPVSRFVELLWERGSAFEQETIARLTTPYLDLSPFHGPDKERLTREAMARREPLIYAGRLSEDGLLGEPDLLRLEGAGYVPIDVKSGAGEEVASGGRKQKPHYAMQLALYVDVLERVGCSAGRRGFVSDAHGDEVLYDLEERRGKKLASTWWETYLARLSEARRIVDRTVATLPANASMCKQCHWRSTCLAELRARDDLSLIPELGRTKRDALIARIPTVAALAAADLEPFLKGKRTGFADVGARQLLKFQRRAQLLVSANPKPYRTAELQFPKLDRELFFDIEVDPLRDVCYLHGFVVRTGGRGGPERYVSCFADEPTEEQEERAFRDAWEFVAVSRPCAIYHYSPYEHTFWRRLQARYPRVCSAADVEALFADAHTIDLYTDVVMPSTEWPTIDYSIKTLAKLSGFRWRDSEASGAASIEWYHRFVATGDAAVRQRLCDYNEDDCRATRVLLDALGDLEPGP